jgi:cobalt ABC transporter, permease protein CbiQ
VTGIVAQSVESITGALRAVFTAEQIAENDGFLQRRDPRVTLIAVAGFALAVMLSRRISVTVCFGLLTVILARTSAVPVRQLAKRSAVVPLVSALIVLPQAVIMPGDTLVSFAGMTVTVAGVEYVILFTLRVGVGVGLLSLIVLTTPFSEVIAAMRSLHIPVALVWVIAITYRYLFLFFDELQRLVLARNSRTTGRTRLRGAWQDASRMAGSFLLRTLNRGERVGRGMRARGGARAPSPYGRLQQIDRYDYALLTVSAVTIMISGVIRWSL